MRPPQVGGDDRDDILEKVRPLRCVYRASVCALFARHGMDVDVMRPPQVGGCDVPCVY